MTLVQGVDESGHVEAGGERASRGMLPARRSRVWGRHAGTGGRNRVARGSDVARRARRSGRGDPRVHRRSAAHAADRGAGARLPGGRGRRSRRAGGRGAGADHPGGRLPAGGAARRGPVGGGGGQRGEPAHLRGAAARGGGPHHRPEPGDLPPEVHRAGRRGVDGGGADRVGELHAHRHRDQPGRDGQGGQGGQQPQPCGGAAGPARRFPVPGGIPADAVGHVRGAARAGRG